MTYPIWREFAYQRHTVAFWIEIYSAAGVFSTLVIAIVTAAALSIDGLKSRKKEVQMQMIGTFLSLSAIAVAADFSEPYPASRWPDLIQEIAAKFFSELQSARFVVLCATSMALAAGMLTLAVLRARRRSENKYPHPSLRS